MANICSVRMRIAAKDAESIQKFIEDVRDHGTFRVYNGIFTKEEEFDPGLILDIEGIKAYDVGFSCKWSFVSAFEEDGVNKMFGKNEPAYVEYFHEFCKDHGVGVEVYTEESGVGFEEHYVIAPSGKIVEDECVNMTEEYIEEDDEWVKEGGFGDPDFLAPKDILEADGSKTVPEEQERGLSAKETKKEGLQGFIAWLEKYLSEGHEVIKTSAVIHELKKISTSSEKEKEED